MDVKSPFRPILANKSMATVTTTVTGYNIKPAEKVTSFMTPSPSCNDEYERRKTAELVPPSSGPHFRSKEETPQHSHFVVVAIDFGTAYSGYAYR